MIIHCFKAIVAFIDSHFCKKCQYNLVCVSNDYEFSVSLLTLNEGTYFCK